MERRGFIAAFGGALLLAGCGGGGGNGGGGTPTAATRTQVQAMHTQMFRGVANIGYQNEYMAFAANRPGGGIAVGGTTGGYGYGSGGSANAPAGDVMIGAFLRNIANTRPQTRAKAVRAATRAANGMTRDEPKPDEPIVIGEPYPMPVYPMEYDYFDYYLGLYVHVLEEATATTYALFEDEAHTFPAGHISTTQPMDWNTYPLTFNSSYEFKKGTLAGSYGSSLSTTTAQGLYTSQYTNVYSDSAKDAGKSTFTPSGDSTWISRTDFAGGGYEENRGTFRSDGSGGTHREGSDGYTADYNFNPDGSGYGRINGSDAGLPAVITWDAQGNTTVRFADGSTIRLDGWGYGGGDGTTGTTGGGNGDPMPVEPDGGIGSANGRNGGGTGGGNGTTTGR